MYVSFFNMKHYLLDYCVRNIGKTALDTGNVGGRLVTLDSLIREIRVGALVGDVVWIQEPTR